MLMVELQTGFLDLIFIAVEAFESIRLLVSVLAESHIEDDANVVAIYLREDKRWLYVRICVCNM